MRLENGVSHTECHGIHAIIRLHNQRKVLSGEIMKMYSGEDVRYIVELFLAHHFNFASVDLNEDSVEKLQEICELYGIEVEGIVENSQ